MEKLLLVLISIGSAVLASWAVAAIGGKAVRRQEEQEKKRAEAEKVAPASGSF